MILLAVLGVLASTASFAGDGPVVLALPDETRILQGLRLPERSLEPEVERGKDGSEHVFVIVPASYSREDWNLLLGKDLLAPGPDGQLSLRIPIEGTEAKVTLVAIGPMGEVEDQSFELRFPTRQSYLVENRPVEAKASPFSGGLGFTSLAFSETEVPDYSSISLTGKLTYASELLSPDWEWAASAYATLFALTHNQDPTARFIGLNARVGYVLPQVAEPWRVTIFAGAYYTTMVVSGGSFGFKNMAGPQLYPTIRKKLKKGSSVSAYLKFSPISDGFRILSLSNRELAAGGSYALVLSDGHPLSLSLDVASLSLALTGLQIQSTSATVGASYGF